MWTETAEGRKYIQEISKSIVIQIAPEEMDLFENLVAEYFQDPTPPDLSPSSKDEPLSFGLGETLVAVAPAAAAMVSAVLKYLMNELVKTTQEESAEAIKKKIKALFNPEAKDKGRAKKERQDLPPLTKEQMEQVKKLACKEAIVFGIAPSKADKMANALIGALALA